MNAFPKIPLYLPLILSVLFCSAKVQSRVFDFKKESVATYLRGSAGLSTLGTQLFDGSSGSGTTFSDAGVTYTFSGEIGLLFTFSTTTFRAGIEALRPKSLEGVTGTDAANNELFTLNSTMLVLIPQIGIDYAYYASSQFKAYVGGSLGSASATFGNHYTLTAAGQAATTPASTETTFSEEGQGTAYMGTFSTGFETIFSDNVTFLLDVGYRYLQIENLTYTSAPGATFVGPISKGDVVANTDGSSKIVNLSGPFGSIAFRFYIDLL